MRIPLLPTLVLALLVGLVWLLPGRRQDHGSGLPILPGASVAGADVALLLSQLPPLDLVEPPPWALERGVDPVARALDRLSWADHGALVASRETLAQVAGAVSGQVLARLRDAGDRDPVLASKLVLLLSDDPAPSDELVEEVVRRALSPSGIVARAALRVLAGLEHPAALGGIVPRLHDADLELRQVARGALAERVRTGDGEARQFVIDELEATATDPDLEFVTALGECAADERALAVLRRVEREAGFGPSLAARASLLVHDDPGARARVEEMIASEDDIDRQNGLRMAALCGRVVGQPSWMELVAGRRRAEISFLMPVLLRAIRTGHDDALLAMELLEEMALDPSHGSQSEALGVLLMEAHPIAMERTRFELQEAVGAFLGATVDRLVVAGPPVAVQFLPLVLGRLDGPATAEPERVVLSRYLASVAPEAGAAIVVADLLDGDPDHAGARLPLLGQIGAEALPELMPRIREDRAAGLLIYLASVTGLPQTLPALETLLLDEGRDAGLRQLALDAVARLRGGPREEVLRRLALALRDPQVSTRARLLFWNYM